MRISLIQSDIVWNNPTGSLARVDKLVEHSLKSKPRLVVLPEMFTTGFSLINGPAAYEAEQISRSYLAETASKHEISIVASIPELKGDKLFNALVVYGPEGLLGTYRKIHLFSYAKENEIYSPGDAPLTLEIAELRITFFVCYDLRFPEAFCALADSTDLFVVVANWPSKRAGHWSTLLQARAIENLAYVVGVNRVGSGGNLDYSGGSIIVSPTGEIVTECGTGELERSSVIEKGLVTRCRSGFPTLRDRRPEVYRGWDLPKGSI